MTNGERIRLMTDEELAECIARCETRALLLDRSWSWKEWLYWLKQEAKE